MEAILKRRPLAPDQVREIVVRMDPRTSVVNDREMPDINIQHMLAIMLVDRTATFAAAHDKKRMQDPLILRHKAKVRLEPNSGQPLLTLTLSDGSSITENPTAVRGTAENPMTRGEVVEKARDLMQPILGVSATTRLIERLLDFENIRNVRELRPLVQRA
jgi:2-methylcitrate dehydratase PrpD